MSPIPIQQREVIGLRPQFFPYIAELKYSFPTIQATLSEQEFQRKKRDMAGAAAPQSTTWKLNKPQQKRVNLMTVAFVTVLCSASYLLGVWQRSGNTSATISAASLLATVPCVDQDTFNSDKAEIQLDFTSHHAVEDVSTVVAPPSRNFPACSAELSEYTPCEDVQRSLKFERDRLVYRERHCPEKEELLKCLVPAPPGYRTPFQWPASRELAWFANVPHKELTIEKAVQNWIRVEGDKFRFPGGGTMFPNGADAYIDDIDRLISLSDGSIRTAIDTGCGVASWGAFLLSRNILAMSFAPRDSHEAQVQFALERGVPAMIGVMASNRLPYPSRSFDMAHCSRCLIPWHQYDGLYLIEIDRVLRPGGYWILSGPPINWNRHAMGWERTVEDLNAEQTSIESVARSLCWKKLTEKADIAIWQKPINHIHCKVNRKVIKSPPFCSAPNPDSAWYTAMDPCITPLPDVSGIKEISGGELKKWPERLTAVPPRIESGSIVGATADSFKQDTNLWRKRVHYYKLVVPQLGQIGRYRNLLDMNANFGGFAAALVEESLWVMNVVPTAANIGNLGVVYERGLIGTFQDWCEALSTYPRTYDFLHADSLFTLYKGRCATEDILLEMDRILRPEGAVIIRDDVDMVVRIKTIVEGMMWDSQIVDHEDGPHQRQKLLLAVKRYWTSAERSNNESSTAS